MTIERVGFIGLGIMGKPMALNLLKAGFAVTVYNRTPQRVAPLREAGAAVAASPADLARQCDVIVSCVTADADVLAVHLDAKTGVLAGVRAGAVVIDCSTVSPAVARQCGSALAAKGAAFLDAPVSGGQGGAEAGTLSIMVGGDPAALEKVRPALQAMGKTITHCGPGGSGYIVKLCNQVLVAINLVGVSEAIALAQACGVNAQAMLQAVGGGAAGSWSLSNLGPKILAGDYRPGFFVDYLLKDLRMTRELADAAATPLPAAALAETLYRAASDQGLGRQGTPSVFEVVKGLRSQQGGQSPAR